MALKDLNKSEDIVVKMSDKGGTVVVLDEKLLQNGH